MFKVGFPSSTPNFFTPLDAPTGSLYDGYGLGALARYGLQNGFFWCLRSLRIDAPCESLSNKSGEAAFPKKLSPFGAELPAGSRHSHCASCGLRRALTRAQMTTTTNTDAKARTAETAGMTLYAPS